MSYEIPQQLEYKEKIMFGLTFKQLAYTFLFAPPIVLVFFKTNWHIVLKIFIGTNLLALGIGFIFLDLERHIRNWYVWYRSRNIEKIPQLSKFIPIKGIQDNIVISTKGVRLAILKITPINFSIKPEESKNAIIVGFQKFLNSLDFPVQILMNTETLNLQDYFDEAEKRVVKTEQFQKLFEAYKEHLQDITKSQNVMNRNFYLIIPEKNDLSIQIQICQNKLGNMGLRNFQLKGKELKELMNRFFEAKAEFFPTRVENYPSYLKIIKEEVREDEEKER